MVGDVHRTLLYGGVFGYPSDTRNVNGKLRLLYEGAPMSFLMEQAGGMSSTGKVRVMEIQPEQVSEWGMASSLSHARNAIHRFRSLAILFALA